MVDGKDATLDEIRKAVPIRKHRKEQGIV